MDKDAALADIDATLNRPPFSDHGGSGAVIAHSNDMHACIRRYAPPGSTFREQADRYVQYHAKSGLNPGEVSSADALRGVLTALRVAVAEDKLRQFEELVHANVYSDLLAQGEGLHREKYSRAATVIVGGALEEHIRLLAIKHGTGAALSDGTPKKASVMNAELKKASVYSETQRAIVEGWQKLRNDAAHGKPGFDGSDTSQVASVKPMIEGIRAFIAQYPA